MVLGKKKILLSVVFIICIAFIFKYIDYTAKNEASKFCQDAYVLQDKNKIIALIPSNFKNQKKNLSISNRNIILRFHTVFMTRYECSILFDEDDKIIGADVFYSD